MAIQLIPSAFAGQMMQNMMVTGKATQAYTILLVVLVIGIITMCTMLNTKDANEADRDYGNK